MISSRLAIHDLDPTAWRNALRLLFPPSRGSTGGSRRPRPTPLVLFVEKGECKKALRPGGPALAAADFPWKGSWSLGRMRRQAGAPIAVAVEDDALERVFAAFEGGIDPKDDVVAQGLVIARAFRAEIGKGIHVDPDPLARVPIPPYAALQKTLDLLLPDGRTGALFIFDGNDVWTSLIVEKQGGEIVRLTTHAALGIRRPDWRGGAHKEILQAIEARFAKVHVGAFMSLDAWRDIVSPQAGMLAQRFAGRQVVLDPAPPWLLAFAGMGAVAGVAQGAGRMFGRFVPQVVKDAAKAVAPLSPFAALGFDPIATFIDLQKIFTGGGS